MIRTILTDNINDVTGGTIEAAGTSSNKAALSVGVGTLGTTQQLSAPAFDGPSTSKAAYVQQQQQQQQQRLQLSQNDAISSQQQHLQQQRRNALPQQKIMQQQPLPPPPHTPPTQFNNAATTPPVFKSPNTVCPMEGKVPLLPSPAGTLNVPRDFPFESMRQARVLQGRETAGTTSGISGGLGPPPPPPPNVTLKLLNSQTTPNGEIVTTAMGAGISNKSQFIHPPPPYPGLGPSSSASSNSTLTASASNSNTVSVTSSATAKPAQQSYHMPTSSSASASPAPTATSTGSNNIAISSPLLVNLLQNDGNSMSSQMKSPQMQTAPTTPQSPIVSMSPSAQMMSSNSPMRCSPATPNEFVMAPTGVPAPDNGNLSSPVVPSSPTGGVGGVGPVVMRSMQQQQPQMLLSPSGTANLYSQGPPTHRFQHGSLRHQQQQQQQQQVQQQQVVHQQRQHQMQGMQPRFLSPQQQQQQFIAQQQQQQQQTNGK